MSIVISDTSVLCYLALVGQMSLLETLFGRIILPDQVLAEWLHPSAPLLLKEALTPLPSFFSSVSVTILLPKTGKLDKGEAAAISIAHSFGTQALLLIDEKRGRAVASALGLRFRGLLGIVIEAHRRNLVDFDTMLAELKPHGFRLSTNLLISARQQLGLP